MQKKGTTFQECEILNGICRFIRKYAGRARREEEAESVRGFWKRLSNLSKWKQCKTLFGFDNTVNWRTFNRIMDQCDQYLQTANYPHDFQVIKNTIDTQMGHLDWQNGIDEDELEQKVNALCDTKGGEYTSPRLQSPKELLYIYQYLMEEIIKAEFLDAKSWHKITNLLTNNDPKVASSTVNDWTPKSDDRERTREIRGISDRNHKVLEAISTTLCDPELSLWTRPLVENEEYISECIECFKERYLDEHDIFKKLPTLTQPLQLDKKKEKDLLNDIQKAPTSRDLADLIQQIDDTYSDDFLLEVLKTLYHRAEYQLIDMFILEKFTPAAAFEQEYQYFLAHFHSIKPEPDYNLAARILRFLQRTDANDFDLETSLVSNLLRNAIGHLDSDKLGDLEVVFHESLQGYRDIFQKYPHYYPGINYAYMLSLYTKLYDPSYEDDTIESIYTDSNPSIEKESASYWAEISDIEFQALLGKFDQEKFDSLLQTERTTDNLVRTLRQVDFYIDTLEEFGMPEKVEASMTTLKERLQEIIDHDPEKR